MISAAFIKKPARLNHAFFKKNPGVVPGFLIVSLSRAFIWVPLRSFPARVALGNEPRWPSRR